MSCAIEQATTREPAGDRSTPEATTARPGLVQIFPRTIDSPPRVWPVNISETIGRQGDCAIRLEDGRVSRQHASLTLTETGLRISDLQSRHGTFVNGERVGSKGLLAKCGSILRCGGTLLLTVSDCDAYSTTHRLSCDFLGTANDVFGGPALWKVWQRASQAAELADPVLLLGESGSGKEAAARLIHASRKIPGPFIAVSVAAFQRTLFESALFGHVRGAFTGASSPKLGALREATNGVLFLDEVGDLAEDLQVKLLRAIEQRRVRPVGADRDYPFDARIVSATSRGLRADCNAGRFRADLYYRLSGIVIQLPPLRKRPDDVILLTMAALARNGSPLNLSVEAAEQLALSPWPGNVRQLHNALAQASMELRVRGGETLRPEHFADDFDAGNAGERALSPESVRAALAKTSGNATRAAKSLGVCRATLYNFCGRHGLALAAVRAELAWGNDLDGESD